MVGSKWLAQEFGDAGVAGVGDAFGVGRCTHHDDGHQTVLAIGAGTQLFGEGNAVHAIEVIINDQHVKRAAAQFNHGAVGVVALADIPASQAAQHHRNQRCHVGRVIGDQHTVLGNFLSGHGTQTLTSQACILAGLCI